MLHMIHKNVLKNILTLIFLFSFTQAIGQVCGGCAGGVGEFWDNCGTVGVCELGCVGCPEPDMPVDQGVLLILGAGLAIIAYTYYKRTRIKTA
jgi:hypothetical protein